MNARIFVPISFLLVLCGLLSCNKHKTGDKLNDLIEWEKVVAFEEYVDPNISKNWASVGADNDMPNCWVHLELLYPQIDDAKYFALRDSLVKTLAQKVSLKPIDSYSKESFNALANGYIQEQVEDYMLDIEHAYSLNFDLNSYSVFTRQIDVCDSLAFNRAGIVSIISLTQEYSGGAHGNEFMTMINYDLARQIAITPSVLFKDPEDQHIKEMLLSRLMETFDVQTPEDLEYAGVYSYEALETANNYYFTDEGITFHFNPYELAAYAVGPIELSLTYQEIAPYLNKEYHRLTTNGKAR